MVWWARAVWGFCILPGGSAMRLVGPHTAHAREVHEQQRTHNHGGDMAPEIIVYTASS
jgi:hypothetical protein